jgi:hypothetical protein
MDQTKMTDAQIINKSLRSLIVSYGKSSNQSKEAEILIEELYTVFALKDDFLKKLDMMDAVFDKFTTFKELQEVTFDLLMVRYLSTDTEDLNEEYFESDEWNHIEDQTLDRGTELLNILIYIKEANDVEAEITIDDFLEEFLLVEDENFSEEQEIYALLIDNKEIIEMDVTEWIEVVKNADDEDPLKEYLLPLFSLFSSDVTEEALNNSIPSDLKDRSLIIAYNSLLTTFASK